METNPIVASIYQATLFYVIIDYLFVFIKRMYLYKHLLIYIFKK